MIIHSKTHTHTLVVKHVKNYKIIQLQIMYSMVQQENIWSTRYFEL